MGRRLEQAESAWLTMKASWHLGEIVDVQDVGEPAARSAEGLARRLRHIAHQQPYII